jgi:hypothetical protein
MVRWYHVPFIVAASGCGLFDGGAALDDGGGNDAPIVSPDGAGDGWGGDGGAADGDDGATDAMDEPAPPVPCSKPIGACVNAVPAGWTVVAFEASRAQSCPANFATGNVIVSPTPQADACPCPCSQATAPSCATGGTTFGHGMSNCNGPGLTVTMGDNLCVPFGPITIDPMNSATKLPLTQGTCLGGVPTPNNSKVNATLMRACAPPSTCAEEVCDGTQPPGFRSCIAHALDLPCPGAPFTDKVAVVGDGASVTCGVCTACSLTASCPASPTLRFYNDTTCTTQVGTLVADGACHNTGSFAVQRIKYDAPPQNVTCTPGSSVPSSAALNNPRTVCCRP